MVIEIISPSNQAHDLVTKMNIYMQYGVKEYWIVNPLLNTVMVYALNEKREYEQKDTIREKGIVTSTVFPDFAVDAVKLFQQKNTKCLSRHLVFFVYPACNGQ